MSSRVRHRTLVLAALVAGGAAATTVALASTGCTCGSPPAWAGGAPATDRTGPMDRRLALKNIRTGLLAGAISLMVFALAWVVGLVY
jgi:hypothetical protein